MNSRTTSTTTAGASDGRIDLAVLLVILANRIYADMRQQQRWTGMPASYLDARLQWAVNEATFPTLDRVPYEAGQQQTPSSIDGVEEVIVGMDRFASGELGAPDGHTSRTLAFDPEKKWLYVIEFDGVDEW